MSPLNPFFLQGSSGEQRLVQDLINEQLRMYGQDVVYLPRKIINKKTVIKEIVASKFDDSFRIEAYLMNYQGFGGQGDILSKFGVQTTDQLTLIISKERYEDFVSPFLIGDQQIQLGTRPEEGDLVYLPLDNTIFEIKYVEGKAPFYQLNNLYVYELRCEVFDYASDDIIDTSLSEVDESVDDFGYITTINMVGTSATSASASVNLSIPTGKSVSSIDLINDGTGYLSTPVVSISTSPNGVSATAVAIMTHRSGQTGDSIDRILIINPGYGYTIQPSVTIKANSGSGAIATAIISTGSLSQIQINDNGFEYSSAPVVSISTAPYGGTNASAEAFINSDGEVTSIGYINAGAGYTAVPAITFTTPSSNSFGNYKFNEIVRGVSTGTTAYVSKWDSNDRKLEVKVTSGSFALGEIVVGLGTTSGYNASYKILSIDRDDLYDPYAENIPIENESDNLLDFSERNPFGDY